MGVKVALAGASICYQRVPNFWLAHDILPQLDNGSLALPVSLCQLKKRRWFLQVLAPALAIPAEPEEEVPLTGLLAAIADILAAVCSQPTWQELHPDTALAALSAMNIAAVSAHQITLPCWA